MAKWIKNLSDEEYHGGNEHLSSSQLKLAYKDMNKFKANLEGHQRRDSSALAFGRMAHCFILENEEFSSRYSVFDDSMDMRKKESKDKKAEFLKSLGLKRMCKLSEHEQLTEMREQILAHPEASRLLALGEAEVSGYYEHKYYNEEGEEESLGLKFRPDFINHEEGYIVDYKTTRDATVGSFSRDCKYNFLYDLSAAMYVHGAKKLTGNDYDYYWIAQEKEAPYSVAVYKLSAETLRYGKEKYEKALGNVIKAMKTKEYFLSKEVVEI